MSNSNLISATQSCPRIKLPLSSIIIEDRLRACNEAHVISLMESLEYYGQIQPLLVRYADSHLIAGGHRIEAMSRLGWTECDVMFREDVSDEFLHELEIEENIRRKDMTWQERVLAIATIHRKRQRNAALAGTKWGQRETGELLNVSLGNINYVLQTADKLRDPSSPYHNLSNLTEAIRLMAQDAQDAAAAHLALITSVPGAGVANINNPNVNLSVPKGNSNNKFQLPIAVDIVGGSVGGGGQTNAPSDLTSDLLGDLDDLSGAVQPLNDTESTIIPPTVIEISKLFFNLPCETFLPQIPSGSIAHIVTDPPYAIDMANLDQGSKEFSQDMSRLEDTHHVKDNLTLLEWFIPEAFRILAPSGILAFWYDVEHHNTLRQWALSAGFRVQEWPLVWIKTHPCMNRFASKNFTKATEFAMVCYKGNATLVSPQSTNYVSADSRICQAKYDNKFAKPDEVWRFILNAIAIRGQQVLDPFGGEFSMALTAINMGLRPICCEKEAHHFNKGLQNVKTLYSELLQGNVNFQ